MIRRTGDNRQLFIVYAINDHRRITIADRLEDCAVGQAVDGSAINAPPERTVLRISPDGGALRRFERVQATNDNDAIVDVWVRVE